MTCTSLRRIFSISSTRPEGVSFCGDFSRDSYIIPKNELFCEKIRNYFRRQFLAVQESVSFGLKLVKSVVPDVAGRALVVNLVRVNEEPVGFFVVAIGVLDVCDLDPCVCIENIYLVACLNIDLMCLAIKA